MKAELDFTTLPKRKTIRGISFLLDPFGTYTPEFREKAESKIKIRKPSDCLPLLHQLRSESQEHFMVITLDSAHQVIKSHTITRGLVNQCQIHPREVFRAAIEDMAVSIIVAHNHPSGNLDPSPDDMMATRRLSEASKTIGIKLLDHFIVAETGFTSLMDLYTMYFS